MGQVLLSHAVVVVVVVVGLSAHYYGRRGLLQKKKKGRCCVVDQNEDWYWWGCSECCVPLRVARYDEASRLQPQQPFMDMPTTNGFVLLDDGMRSWLTVKTLSRFAFLHPYPYSLINRALWRSKGEATEWSKCEASRFRSRSRLEMPLYHTTFSCEYHQMKRTCASSKEIGREYHTYTIHLLMSPTKWPKYTQDFNWSKQNPLSATRAR